MKRPDHQWIRAQLDVLIEAIIAAGAGYKMGAPSPSGSRYLQLCYWHDHRRCFVPTRIQIRVADHFPVKRPHPLSVHPGGPDVTEVWRRAKRALTDLREERRAAAKRELARIERAKPKKRKDY